MMMSMTIENKVKTLDKWDSTPLVSTIYSGPLRILAGTVQVAVGVTLAGLSALFGWVNGMTRWKQDCQLNLQEIVFGLNNLMRGSLALIPGIGNLLINSYYPLSEYYELQKDKGGIYTLRHTDTSGRVNTIRGRELAFQSDNLIIDTTSTTAPIPKKWEMKQYGLLTGWQTEIRMDC